MRRKDWNQIAENYHDVVISPFQKGVKNPLFDKLNGIKDKENKVIMDIGCGRGEILDNLAKQFKKVYAIDFSSTMIHIAQENSSKENIEFFIRDMRKLAKFRKKFDVVVSVNSVLLPEIREVKKSLSSIYNTLKKNGKFYGIFPSMGSILYQGFLIIEEQLKSGKNEKLAIKKAKQIMERRKYDLVCGLYCDNGQVQKFYYDFELKIRLQDAGFKNIKLTKVLYPWGKEISDFVDFPGRPKMWDWFVSADK